MSIIECDQTRCLFNKKNHGEILCPYCEECGATSNIINDSCVNCWNCLKDEGYVRKGKAKEAEKIVIEVENDLPNMS